MYACTWLTIRMFIFIAGTTCLLMLGCIISVQGAVESQGESPLTGSSQSKVQILLVGEFLCQISAEPNEAWFGLYATKDGYSLMSSVIDIDAFYDLTIRDDEDVTGATRVSVRGRATPLFLITGMDTLKTGMVKTLFAGRLPLPMGSSLEFSLDEASSYSITAFGGMESNAGSVVHRVELVNGSRSQLICSYDRTDAAVTYLLWAGDLDRDGKLDMLIDTVCDYNALGPVLFLSSIAEDGDLMNMAAQFETSRLR